MNTTLDLASLGPVIRSVYETQDEILAAILRLHCPGGFQADLTYGHGTFWKRLPEPPMKFDIQPMKAGIGKACSTNLPIATGLLDNAVFDPPFLTYVRQGRDHQGGKMMLSARFGGYHTYEELSQHYRGTLRECYRVLQPRGKLVFKCQDIIHNHKMHCTHAYVIAWATVAGFRLLDLFVLPAKHRMPSPQKGTQRHARIFHAYFLVFERDRKPHLQCCPECGEPVEEVVGCPDGSEICQACFDAGAH